MLEPVGRLAGGFLAIFFAVVAEKYRAMALSARISGARGVGLDPD